ncbi:hypothetical protein EJ06DRAFT_584748 [Trichodelitschia bisporula]|uniref:Uncharacterized protein n=1 Tax=Trichodelitschia bisporula TaxID=703511 RepID=A0A6G1HMJ0_9PEZI|nr:hypothetical protein EJ06DRAFT_584748 [Trichodelitschia bisporula]
MAGIVTNIITNSLSGLAAGAITTAGGYAGDAVNAVGDAIEAKGRAYGDAVDHGISSYASYVSSYGEAVKSATAPNPGTFSSPTQYRITGPKERLALPAPKQQKLLMPPPPKSSTSTSTVKPKTAAKTTVSTAKASSKHPIKPFTPPKPGTTALTAANLSRVPNKPKPFPTQAALPSTIAPSSSISTRPRPANTKPAAATPYSRDTPYAPPVKNASGKVVPASVALSPHARMVRDVRSGKGRGKADSTVARGVREGGGHIPLGSLAGVGQKGGAGAPKKATSVVNKTAGSTVGKKDAYPGPRREGGKVDFLGVGFGDQKSVVGKAGPAGKAPSVVAKAGAPARKAGSVVGGKAGSVAKSAGGGVNFF